METVILPGARDKPRGPVWKMLANGRTRRRSPVAHVDRSGLVEPGGIEDECGGVIRLIAADKYNRLAESLATGELAHVRCHAPEIMVFAEAAPRHERKQRNHAGAHKERDDPMGRGLVTANPDGPALQVLDATDRQREKRNEHLIPVARSVIGAAAKPVKALRDGHAGYERQKQPVRAEI